MGNVTVQPVEGRDDYITGVPKTALTLDSSAAKVLTDSGLYEKGGKSDDASKAAGEQAMLALGPMVDDQKYREAHDGTSEAAMQNAVNTAEGSAPASAGVSKEEEEAAPEAASDEAPASEEQE